MANDPSARIRDLIVTLANEWATTTGPRQPDRVIGAVLQRIDGWDEMCAATWLLAVLAGDALRGAHAIEAGQDLPLVFVDHTGKRPDVDDVPPTIRAAGRYFTAAVSRDVETGAAIWDSVPKDAGDVRPEAASFLNHVWFASLEAYRKAYIVERGGRR